MYEQAFDFGVPEKYGGKEVELKSRKQDGDYGRSEDVILTIPRNARYLNVNSLEDEEESHGCQGLSDWQEVIYFDGSKECIGAENFYGKTLTDFLIDRLE